MPETDPEAGVLDRLVSFPQASRLMRRYSPLVRGRTTLREWHTDGLQREDGATVFLRAVRLGRTKFTTIRWINEFLKSLEDCE